MKSGRHCFPTPYCQELSECTLDVGNRRKAAGNNEVRGYATVSMELYTTTLVVSLEIITNTLCKYDKKKANLKSTTIPMNYRRPGLPSPPRLRPKC